MTFSSDSPSLGLPALVPTAHAVLQQAIGNQAFPGAAYGVWLRGRVHTTAAVGRFTYASDSSSVLPETVFDIASISKVVATTAMSMLLWEQGKLDLDEPIIRWLPVFANAAHGTAASERQSVTIRMLLAHSSGLPAY
ncbi:MAG TPA: serine hydrolase domain-containing protein, partial [Acidobacteriaceae bacterium]|nr:serine hydrolase domain-containing protein [Acidobacteriaceae bacterium]